MECEPGVLHLQADYNRFIGVIGNVREKGLDTPIFPGKSVLVHYLHGAKVEQIEIIPPVLPQQYITSSTPPLNIQQDTTHALKKRVPIGLDKPFEFYIKFYIKCQPAKPCMVPFKKSEGW